MTITTDMNSFIARAGGSPKRSPRSPSPIHHFHETLKVSDLMGLNRLGSLMVMTQSQGISTRVGKSGGIEYIQIRHQGGWNDGNACRGAGIMRVGLYDDGTSVKLATWGIIASEVELSKEWQSRVTDICDGKWDIRKKGRGSCGGFCSRSRCVDNMNVKEMCDIIKQFM